MTATAEAKSGPVLAKSNDARVTPVGKFIRAVRFDELPQIFNVLKGDMSIVGPRPERPSSSISSMQKTLITTYGIMFVLVSLGMHKSMENMSLITTVNYVLIYFISKNIH